MRPAPLILLTGATGLLGRATLARLLADEPTLRVAALVRAPERWALLAASLGSLASRVEPLIGDVTVEGLGLGREARRTLRSRVAAVAHFAANTTFSQSRDDARASNTTGTRNVLALADECGAARVVHVSTAFVAGTRVGFIADDEASATEWVNEYERSKFEAEELVRAQRIPWMILRPSTVVCDDVDGRVTQINAVHRALRLCHAGLAAMLPGAADSPVDVVPARWVAEGIARVIASGDLRGRSLHLCAGDRAMPLGELLDRTWEHWARDPVWKRRAIERPLLTDLQTWRLFESAVRESADPRLARVVHALSHFAPQLALPKRFETAGALAIAGEPAPPPSRYWNTMLDHLHATAWGTLHRRVA